ncbi:hypothetical protein [Granulicella tundricola]|nr:hypothetical protein [Granulicella tundricola]
MALCAGLLCAGSPALLGQSLKLDDPAPLRAGLNSATIDSFGGNQYWVLTVGPGKFTATFHFGGTQEGFNTGGRPNFFAGFKPKVDGTTLTHADFPGGSTWSGTATKASRLELAVTPAPGSLVRQTTSYTIEVTGAVAFGGAAGASAGPSPVGIYQIGIGGHVGIAKFTADGQITATTNETGTWKVFDEDSKSYVIVFAGTRYSLTYQPGRGFIDNNGYLTFKQTK